MRWEKEIKKQVKNLRSKGLTYSEIKEKVGKNIPKSTLSNWCRGVKLPSFYKEKVRKINIRNQIKARQIACLVNRKKRKEFLESLRRKNLYLLGNIDKGVLKLLLAIFYLAEGAKHPSTRFLKFGSTNSETIKFFLRSIKKCFKLKDSKFRVGIICRADQNLTKIKNYWINITKIDKSLFYQPRIDKRTIGKKTKKKDYKGVCIIHYFDTNIQLELQLLGESIVKRV